MKSFVIKEIRMIGYIKQLQSILKLKILVGLLCMMIVFLQCLWKVLGYVSIDYWLR